LDGVTLDADTTVLAIAGACGGNLSLTVLDGLTLNGTLTLLRPGQTYSGVQLNFSGSQELLGHGRVVFADEGVPWCNTESAWVQPTSGTLIIGPGITIDGNKGTVGNASLPLVNQGAILSDGGQTINVLGSVTNLGTISADVAGGTITIAGGSLNNEGTVEAMNGGTIQPTSSTTVNTGTIVIDSGTMTFANSFTQTAGTLDFGLDSASVFGQITFSGDATLSGTLTAHLGYMPNIGDSFAVLNFGNNTLSFTNVSLPLSNDWQTNAANGVLTLVAGNALPYSVTVSPTNSIVPVGSTVTLVATATGPGPLGFQWLHNGADIAGATNATLTLTNVSKSATGAYTVSVSNSGGSKSSAPVQVLVLAPPALVTSPPSQTASVGSAVELSVTISGDQPSYQWFFDGASIAGATNSNLLFNDVTRAQAGSYVVVVTNLVGAVTSTPPTILTVTTPPVCPGAPSGMVAWWHGDGDTSDYAGTNDAVFEGTAAYGPGEVGQAFRFDGFSSYLEVPDSPLWDFGTNDFTFELWANFSATNFSLAAGDGSMVLLAHDEESGTRNKWLFGFGGGEIYFYINGAGATSHFLAEAPFNPQTNQWYHLGLTREGSVYRLYLNGAPAATETNSSPIPSANAPLTIGQAEDFFMQGLMDEISIYDRALTPGEIAGIYQAGSFGTCHSSQPFTIAQPGFNSSRQFQFQILGGQAGVAIQVQASSDLAHWSNIWQTTNINGSELFSDPNTDLNPRRFYRATSNQ
jgi:hypothetical protein